jgi:hypothetical protein
MFRKTLVLREVNSIVRYSPDKVDKLIFRPMSKLLEFREKCENIAHSPSNGANVHKLAPLLEVISEVLSDPYYEHSPNECGDHHIQDAIDCLQVAARHLTKATPTQNAK